MTKTPKPEKPALPTRPYSDAKGNIVHPANHPDAQAARKAGLDHHAITRDADGAATGWVSCLCDIGSEHDA